MLSTKLINTAKGLVAQGYSDQFIDAVLLSNGSYSITEINDAIKIARGEKVDELVNLDVEGGNKFMKILIACGITLDQMRDYEWYVRELHKHEYHCTGYHPVPARIDVIKSGIVIH